MAEKTLSEETKQAQLVMDHFDRMSVSWADLYEYDLNFYHYNFIVRRKHVLDLLGDIKGRFLDAGCGTGDFLLELLNRGTRVFALDFAKEMIDQAKARVGTEDNGRLHFSVGNVCNLEFEDNFFDAVIGVGLIEYVSDVDSALSEFRRVLKPGGILIVTVPNVVSPFMAYETMVPKSKRLVKRLLAAFGLRRLEPQFLHRHFLPWMVNRQLRKAGFKKLDHVFCTYGFSSDKLSNFSLQLSKKLDKFARSPIGLLGTNYIVKAQKL